MENRILYSDIKVNADCTEVLKLAGAQEGSSSWDMFLEEYEEIAAELEALIEPQAVFCFGTMPEALGCEAAGSGSSVVFSLLTVGDGISRYCTELFEQGDYVKGMLADAAASVYLFALEREAMQRLKEVCAGRHVGIRKRLEAPNDIPMEAQRAVFETCRAEEIGMRLSESCMLIPVKSSAQILVLTEDESLFRAQHDCSRCSAVNCRLRKTQGGQK